MTDDERRSLRFVRRLMLGDLVAVWISGKCSWHPSTPIVVPFSDHSVEKQMNETWRAVDAEKDPAARLKYLEIVNLPVVQSSIIIDKRDAGHNPVRAYLRFAAEIGRGRALFQCTSRVLDRARRAIAMAVFFELPMEMNNGQRAS